MFDSFPAVLELDSSDRLARAGGVNCRSTDGAHVAARSGGGHVWRWSPAELPKSDGRWVGTNSVSTGIRPRPGLCDDQLKQLVEVLHHVVRNNLLVGLVVEASEEFAGAFDLRVLDPPELKARH